MGTNIYDYEYKEDVYIKIEKVKREGSWSYCFMGQNPKYFKNFHTLINNLSTVYWMFFPKDGVVIDSIKRGYKRCKTYKIRFREIYRFSATFENKEYMSIRSNKQFKEKEVMADSRNFIKLNNKYVSQIKDGTKTKTTRFGRRDYQLGRASLSSSTESISVEIIGITYKKLVHLTEEDAIADGFDNERALMAELLIYYPDLTVLDEVTIVEFRELDSL